jgi:hypothetical protein
MNILYMIPVHSRELAANKYDMHLIDVFNIEYGWRDVLEGALPRHGSSSPSLDTGS